MCSRSLNETAMAAYLMLLLCSGDACCAERSLQRRVFRVCADPNNLPFSNQKREGFENRIAELIAGHLNARVEYTWFAQRRGFIRNTLDAHLCDVVMGVPAGFEAVETTRPYYRSTYVFVTRQSRKPVTSLDDPVLRSLRIGVHIVGDDYANPPPAQALARRNIIHNVSGYSIYGNYSQPNPPARLIEAVAAGEVDVAMVWGPVGGYFGKRQQVPLQVVPIPPVIDPPQLPFVFDIAMGVRKGNKALRQELQEALGSNEQEIQKVLVEYGVPLRPMADSAKRRVER